MNDLVEASKSISVVPVMMDGDIESDCVRRAGSHTRNLLRVKRGIDMVKVLFEHIISSEYVHFLEPLNLIIASWCWCYFYCLSPSIILCCH